MCPGGNSLSLCQFVFTLPVLDFDFSFSWVPTEPQEQTDRQTEEYRPCIAAALIWRFLVFIYVIGLKILVLQHYRGTAALRNGHFLIQGFGFSFLNIMLHSIILCQNGGDLAAGSVMFCGILFYVLLQSLNPRGLEMCMLSTVSEVFLFTFLLLTDSLSRTFP